MAADSGRLREACVSAHTERGRCHPDTSYRVPKRSSGRSSARRVGPQVLQRHHGVAKGDFWTVFGTAILPTGTSEPSSRGEASPNRSQNGPFPMHQSVFGTATLPTGAPGASRRDEGGLLDGLWHGYPAHRCSRGILAWRRGSSFRPLARLPCPQVPNCYPRGVNKRSADGQQLQAR